MLHFFIHLIKLILYIGKKASPPQGPEVNDALFVRKGRTGEEYLKLATNAMINDGKNISEVKDLLRSKGMYEENIDFYAKKTQERYDEWLSKNGNRPQLTSLELYERLHKQISNIDPAITLISAPEENHAHHFSALIGKERYYTEAGRTILYAITAAALKTTPVLLNGPAAIRQLNFHRYNGGEDNPYLRVLSINGRQEAVFPYLKSDSIISFQTRKIIEWDDDDPFEAEIEGNRSGQYSLGFYATDYAVKRHIYKLKQDINIRLSAFLLELTVSEANSDKEGSMDYRAGYWPNPNYGNYSYFNFEGVVLKIKMANVSKITIGAVITLKVADNSFGNDLVIDAYVTNVNIFGAKIKKDMHVKGTLWFQGELAD